MSARELQEPQPVGRLRAAGWQLPDALPAEYVLRVYDTRLEPVHLRQRKSAKRI